MIMKRHISLFVFFCLPGVFLAGCSDADRSSLMGEEEVPVELSALEGDVSSRAAVSAGSKPQAEFEAAMVFSRTGETTPLRWLPPKRVSGKELSGSTVKSVGAMPVRMRPFIPVGELGSIW